MGAVRTFLVAAAAAVMLALPATAGASPGRSAFAADLASLADCSSGPRTLSQPGSRVYPDQGNGGYTSVHTDLHVAYDTAANLFLPGTRAELTIRATQCLTDFSFDFERTAMSGSAAGPNMTVQAVSVDGVPASFDFRQPTYPGNPNGPDDPNPLAHAISNVNPVSATNPNPPACSPQTSGNTQNGLQCPANKLVITPATPIPDGATITVRIEYTGRPGVHVDGDGSTEGWFRVNTTAAPNDGSFVTTEPVGSMAWMPLNNHPSAKPTYDVYDTVPAGKTAIAPGTLVGASLGPTFATLSPTAVNPPDASFPGGSWLWHWHSPEPIASYLVTNTIGSYDLVARVGAGGREYYQALASGLTAARKTAIKAVLDTHESITLFQERFNGPFPFTTNGVIVALPSVGFAEEMQTKITFGNGATSTPSVGTFHHENMHQWFGDHVSEGAFNLTFWKEGWATVGEYLNTANTAANGAGGLGTPAGDAAFDTSLISRFNTNYNTASSTAWVSAPSNPTVGNLFTTVSTYTRPGTTYLALRQILGASASRPANDRWLGAMRQILADFGGSSITQEELQEIFHEWLPNQSAGCHARLDQFFAQWFDTAYPAGGGANRPQLTGPGLAGSGFYDDAGACPRAEQTIAFAALPDLPPTAPDFSVTASSSEGLPIAFSASGVCTVSAATVHLTGQVGTCTITASQAGTGVWKPASVARSFAVRGPEVSVTASPVQYSDAPTVTVAASDAFADGSSLSATATGLPAGLSLAVDATSADGARPGTRTWGLAGTVAAGPGSYPVTVTVANGDGTAGSASFTLVVDPEDASVAWTGDTLAFTTGATAAVLLRATVEEAADGALGDIGNAAVTFREGPATLCGPFPAAALEPGAGTAGCTASLALGTHVVQVLVGGFYAGTGATLIEVAEPNGSFVTGGGGIRATASAGSRAADAGSRIGLAFTVKYSGKNAANAKGQATVQFTSGGRSYQLKSNAIESLGLALRTPAGAPCPGPPSAGCLGLAELRTKASLTDVTDPLNPVPVAGNLTLQLTLTDRGEPGRDDTVGITAWSGSSLVLSSGWSGGRTVESALAGGNVVVH